MKSLSVIAIGVLIVGLTVLGCSQQMSGQGDAGWVTLLDGSNPKTLDNWNRIGAGLKSVSPMNVVLHEA